MISCGRNDWTGFKSGPAAGSKGNIDLYYKIYARYISISFKTHIYLYIVLFDLIFNKLINKTFNQFDMEGKHRGLELSGHVRVRNEKYKWRSVTRLKEHWIFKVQKCIEVSKIIESHSLLEIPSLRKKECILIPVKDSRYRAW